MDRVHIPLVSQSPIFVASKGEVVNSITPVKLNDGLVTTIVQAPHVPVIRWEPKTGGRPGLHVWFQDPEPSVLSQVQVTDDPPPPPSVLRNGWKASRETAQGRPMTLRTLKL